MFSIVTIVLSSLVLGSVPSLAAPIGTRDIHVRAMRGDLASAPVAREEVPVARSIIPDTPVVNAVASGPKIYRALDEDSTAPLRRHHARDFLRSTPDNIPQRRRIVFARDDVEVRHTATHPDVKKDVLPEPLAKREAVQESAVKREALAGPEVKREEPAQPVAKRDVVPEPEVKREEVKRAVLPVLGQNPRNSVTNSTEIETVPVSKREANSTSTAPHTKRGPISLVASFKRELERLD